MAALVVYIISIMAAAIISILYSYFFYKKKLATGEGLKIQYNTINEQIQNIAQNKDTL